MVRVYLHTLSSHHLPLPPAAKPLSPRPPASILSASRPPTCLAVLSLHGQASQALCPGVTHFYRLNPPTPTSPSPPLPFHRSPRRLGHRRSLCIHRRRPSSLYPDATTRVPLPPARTHSRSNTVPAQERRRQSAGCFLFVHRGLFRGIAQPNPGVSTLPTNCR